MTKKTNKPGLIGKKIGMTQYYSDSGDHFGVTVLKVGPCTVTQVKQNDGHGYNAVQLGFDEVEFRRINRAQRGHFEKKGLKAQRVLREIRVDNPGAFQVGDLVDVTGVSKGKGFQGVIKRHHKAGGPKSHGSTFHRSTGSIGQRTYPGKVFKLMKLTGPMGDRQVTVSNLKVVKVDTENHLLVLNGAVPGAENALILVKNKHPEFEKRLLSSVPSPKEAAAETAPEEGQKPEASTENAGAEG